LRSGKRYSSFVKPLSGSSKWLSWPALDPSCPKEQTCYGPITSGSFHALAVQEGKNILFAEAASPQWGKKSMPKIQNLIGDLAFLWPFFPTHLAHARENFIYQLLYTGYGWKQQSLYDFRPLYPFGAIRTPHGSGPIRHPNPWSELMGRLDLANTLPELVSAFKDPSTAWPLPGQAQGCLGHGTVEHHPWDINKEPQKPWAFRNSAGGPNCRLRLS